MEILWPLPNSLWSHSYAWNISIREKIDENLQQQSYEHVGVLEGWVLHRLDPYCTNEAKGAIFNICHPELGCDTLSRYSEPRSLFHLETDNFLQTDYEFFSSVTCYRLRQLNCPANIPIALRIHMKAGSTAATLWAAALEEGLLRRLKALSHEAREALEKGTPSGWMLWYSSRLSEEVFEMAGCDFDKANMLHQQSIALRLLADGYLGAPLALSPTCCSKGIGRLRVAFVRHPFARLWSYFDTYVQNANYVRESNFTGGFEMWISQLLDEWPHDWKCQQGRATGQHVLDFVPDPDSGIHLVCKAPWREAKKGCYDPLKWCFTYMDWEHLAPISLAIRAEGHGDPKDFFPFRLESPMESLAFLEHGLCEQFDYCPSDGLPPFPSQLKSSVSRHSRRSGSFEWPHSLREGLAWRYREDFSTFGYTVAWHPRSDKMR